MENLNRILGGHKYVGNFLGAPVQIGMVYRMDDEQFIPAIHFNDQFPDIDLGDLTDTGAKGVIKFSSTKDVSVTIGGSASSGIRQSEVKLSFRRKRSVAGALSDARTRSLRYVPIRSQLKAMWQQHGFDEYRRSYIFVYEIVTAASGTLIYSEERNNTVVLKNKSDRKVSGIADLASGNFEYVSNSKRTLEIIRQTAHRPLFKAFRFRRNWQPEILG